MRVPEFTSLLVKEGSLSLIVSLDFQFRFRLSKQLRSERITQAQVTEKIIEYKVTVNELDLALE